MGEAKSAVDLEDCTSFEISGTTLSLLNGKQKMVLQFSSETDSNRWCKQLRKVVKVASAM